MFFFMYVMQICIAKFFFCCKFHNFLDIYKKNFLIVVISMENRKFSKKNFLFVIILVENRIIIEVKNFK